MTSLAHDLRYALRLIRRRPAVAAAAMLTFALGIGANTAIFTVVNAVLFKPLPYASSDRLMFVSIDANTGFGDRTALPVADFLAWQAANRACEKVAAFTDNEPVAVTGIGEAEAVVATAASAGFFQVLGVKPALGRLWLDGDDRPGIAATVVVSHGFWQRRLNGDAGAIGRTLTIEGRPYQIIGVAPEGFAFPPRSVELWTILPLERPSRRGPYFLHGLGLTNAGTSAVQVQADLTRADAAVRQESPRRDAMRYRVEPLKTVITGDVRTSLMLLLAAAAMVLMVAIVNVANLLLARAAERERELAVRAAMGAGRGRLVRQLVTEGLVLAVAGAAAGWALAAWATRVLVAIAPASLPRLNEIHADVRVFAFTFICTAVSGILFGASPALHRAGGRVPTAIDAGTRTAGGQPARLFRNALVVVEIALALTLAIGATLLGKSLIALQQDDAGFRPDHVLTTSVMPPAARYADRSRLAALFNALIDGIDRLPGVTAAAVTNSLPPDGLSETDNFVVEDAMTPVNRPAPVGPILSVSSDYFRVLRVPLLRGRWFSDADRDSSLPVAIISASLARQHLGTTNPIGRRIKQVADWPRPDNLPWRTIVGVVADVKYAGLAGQTGPAVYLPLRQVPFRNQHLVVRTTADPAAAVSGIHAVVRGIDPDLPLGEMRTLDDRMWAAAGQPRFRTSLVAAFGVMGLVLAAIGIYGVVSCSMAQRVREIGIRVALGATRGNLVWMVLGETLALTAAGTCIGLALALSIRRLLAAVLFAVSPTDAAMLATSTGIVVAVAVGSALLPARRAASVDPSIALRAE